ncbi:MAG: hypothetical protein J6D21_03930, partial [Clostridia bacterium]|nr:hypothetical protein [Clostridia bacterium]
DVEKTFLKKGFLHTSFQKLSSRQKPRGSAQADPRGFIASPAGTPRRASFGVCSFCNFFREMVKNHKN